MQDKTLMNRGGGFVINWPKSLQASWREPMGNVFSPTNEPIKYSAVYWGQAPERRGVEGTAPIGIFQSVVFRERGQLWLKGESGNSIGISEVKA
jgi:hypothetical protein